ncbi:MAG: phosphate ABC transporter substrate-binding protein [Oligoflexia bacterium]|nr:phosphate ABC transporter substrate-binding protein [Oligoflexia bacterium]
MKKTLGMAPVLLLLLLPIALSKVADAKVAIITHPGAPAELTGEQVRRIFLGKDIFFPDGTRARPVDLSARSPVRTEFYGTFFDLRESEIRAYWAGRVFTGKGVPPPVIGTDDEVRRFVAATPGAIAYVDPGAVDQTVRVLHVLP